MKTIMITGSNLGNNQHTNKLDMHLRREAQVRYQEKKKEIFLDFVKQTETNKIINSQHWKS